MVGRVDLDDKCKWRIHLFGGLAILRDEKPVAPPPYRSHGLLAALLLNPRPVSRVFLCGLLYPEYPEDYGRKRISDLLWLLRKALPDLPLDSADGCVHLPEEARWLDVEVFREACRSSDPDDWREAIELFRGDLLPDNYAEWLLVERENLLILYVNMSKRLIDWYFKRRRYQEAIPSLERLVQIEPLDEDAVYKLIRAHGGSGNRGAALAVYDRFLSQCSQEGIHPNPLIESYVSNLRLSYIPKQIKSLEKEFALENGFPLEAAQLALERGDRWHVEAYLERLKSNVQADQALEVSLLEIDLAFEFGEPQRAEQLLLGLDSEELPVRMRLARLASEKGDASIAGQMAKDVIATAQNSRDESLLMEALLVLARVQMRQGETPQAIMTSEKVINLSKKHGTPFPGLRAQILLGRILMRQGRLERALELLGAAYTSAVEKEMRSQAAIAVHYSAEITYLMGRFLDAREFCREELEIWRNLGAPAQEAQALQTLATIYCQLGRHKDAIHTLEEAQAILDRLGDPVLAARNLYHLAATIPYHDEAQVSSAISLSMQALDVFETYQQTRWVASTLRALGYCYWLAGGYAEALEKYKLAYDLHDLCGEMSILPEILAYQALALLGLGRQEEALECSRQAVLNLTGLTLENDLNSEIFYAHAAVLDALGNQQEAHKYFTQAYENLLVYAQPMVDEQARRAYFERDPTVRRLMREVYTRGIAEPPQAGVVERSLHPRIGLSLRPVEVRLTLDAGPADQAIKQGRGAIALRRAKLERIRSEARLQGASPTIQEMAELLGVSARTVKRDLAALRKKDKP